ncbi:MAG: M56 family metallopeptidase [Pseudomonadota bacterium]
MSASALTFFWQTTLAVSVLTAIILLIRRPVATAFGAKAAYALWAFPALRLVMPPLPAGWSLFGLVAPAKPATEPAVMTFTDGAHSVSLSAPTSGDVVFAPPMPPAVPVPYEPSLFEGTAAQIASVAGPALLAAWLAGAIGTFALGLYRQWVFMRVVKREMTPASLAIQTEALEACQTLGLDRRRIEIATSYISSSPLVTGLARPVVLLPAWFESDYSPVERRVALMHELAHVKRRDLWALQLSAMVQALQWFNPLVHYALRAFRSDQEAACDADVLGVGTATPHEYGATLVKAVRRTRPVREPALAASLPLTHSLTERLKIMRNPLPTDRRRKLGAALTASVGAVALIASAGSMSASAHPHELDDEDEARLERHFIFHDGDEERVILLTDPMEKVEIDLRQIEDLTEMITEDTVGMEALIAENVAVISTDVATVVADMAGQMTFTLDDGTTVIGLPGEIGHFVAQVTRLAEDGSINDDEIDRLTDEFEERVEAWADELEARIELAAPHWEARIEAEADRWGEAFEARMEAFEARIEARSDSIERHAERIEAAGELVEELVEECEDVDGFEVVTLTDDETGETHKAICLRGDGDLTTSEILSEARASGELSEAELKRLQRKLKKADNVSWSYSYSIETSPELEGADDD